MQAAENSVNRQIGFRQLEDPREQAMLRQGLAARGVSRSSIARQDLARLTDIQQRRMAGLGEQLDLARRGLSVLHKNRLLERRMGPWNIWGDLTNAANSAASFMTLGNEFFGGGGGGAGAGAGGGGRG